jgi:hypothetical protein
MSKTNDTSKPEALDKQLDDHGALADSELVALTAASSTKRSTREHTLTRSSSN